MTNELRIKIAQSLGWKIKKHDGIWPDHYRIRRPDGESYAQVELDDVLPNWPEDANAALQLVEVLAKEGWEWEAYNYGEGVVFAFIMHEARFEATAPTLPEAICLAYCAVKSIPTDK